MDFFKFLPKVSLTAAQKERYETKIMLLTDKHEKAMEKLETENRDLRAKIDPLTQENKQLHISIEFLQGQLKWYEDMEKSREVDTGL
jgi:predicted RNase H-like nuclease (RuvC/YqgF family)